MKITHIGARDCVTRPRELIYELDRIKTSVPVFIDSPLGIGITKLYQDIDINTNNPRSHVSQA